MKAPPGLFLFLLVIWIGGSTWYYICKIKDHCEKEIKTELIEKEIQDQDQTNDITNLETTDTTEPTKEQVIDDVRSKIENGYTVYNFPKNSTVNENIESSFDEFAQNLKLFFDENPDAKIEIIGHTDDIGSDAANMAFGKKRASFIKSELIKAGIKADQIMVSSMGKNEPIASNSTEEGRKQNRRVVIKLIQN